MQFKLHTQASLRGSKIDWTTPVELTDEQRAAIAAHDLEGHRIGVLLRGFAVGPITYPRGTLVLRVAEAHEHFFQVPAEDEIQAVIPKRVVESTWQVARVATVDRYRGTIGTREDGERLDIILAGTIPDLSRAQAQRLIKEGCCRVAGHPIPRPNLRLHTGDSIELDVELSIVN